MIFQFAHRRHLEFAIVACNLQEQALLWAFDVDEGTAASAGHEGRGAGHVKPRGFDLGVVAHLAFLGQDGADVFLEELGLIRLRNLA